MIADEGTAVILIEQHAEVALSLTQRRGRDGARRRSCIARLARTARRCRDARPADRAAYRGENNGSMKRTRPDSHHPCRQPAAPARSHRAGAREAARRGGRSRRPTRAVLKESVAAIVRKQADARRRRDRRRRMRQAELRQLRQRAARRLLGAHRRRRGQPVGAFARGDHVPGVLSVADGQRVGAAMRGSSAPARSPTRARRR